LADQWEFSGVLIRPGDTFGDYQIQEKLQESCSYCCTYRAVQQSTGADVALKIFHFSHAKARALFETEVQSLQKIQGYPGIHPLRDFGEKDGFFYISTNFVKGGCLGRLLKKYPQGMDLQVVLELFAPIADAIDYCHAMGIAHRDLKPANILLDETEQGLVPYLTDFGIARMLNESQEYETVSFSGTLAYSAPETFDHHAVKTHAVDIYSLGVILYEALEGQPPFRDADPIRMIDLHENAPVPYPQRIAAKTNPDVVLALMRAMSKNPIDRPGSAGKLIEDIRRASAAAQNRSAWLGPGKQIDDYIIEGSLGVGRLSQTFLAKTAVGSEMVVMKIFATASMQPDAMRSFRDEVTALKNLGQPKGVLPLLDNGERDGVYYLVTKYMPDGSLRWHMEQHPKGLSGSLSFKDIIRLFSQIADGLDSIHKRGIVHRDLKPENIVLRRRDGQLEPFLTDFGIARVLAGTQSFYTQNVTGTFRYMAPESWDPGLKKSAAVDIYAFGVMLFEALEGHPPYKAEYPAIIQQHVSGEIPVPERIAREYGMQAASLIMQSMAKNASDRPKSAAGIMEDLKRAIPGVEMIGERFGSYRLERFLGASAVGQTFKAQDEQSKDWVAIKILPFVSPTQELEIYQKLAPQPGILALRDSGLQDGKYYLVTDYADGGNLRQLLESPTEKPDARGILDMFRSIASAIDHLHQMKIVHRDMKPENVVLRKTDQGYEPLITDFGISKAVSQTQSFYTATVAGTSYYTAPEAWTPSARQTYAVDIYALGIMLYEALEGDLPFKAEYPAIGLQHLSAEVPYPKKIAAQAGSRGVNVLLRALAKNPLERPASAVELVEQLSQAYERHSSGASAPFMRGFFERLGKALSGRRKLAAAGALVLLLGVSAASVWAARAVPPVPPWAITVTSQGILSNPTSIPIVPATPTASPTSLQRSAPSGSATAGAAVSPTAALLATETPALTATRTPAVGSFAQTATRAAGGPTSTRAAATPTPARTGSATVPPPPLPPTATRSLLPTATHALLPTATHALLPTATQALFPTATLPGLPTATPKPPATATPKPPATATDAPPPPTATDAPPPPTVAPPTVAPPTVAPPTVAPPQPTSPRPPTNTPKPENTPKPTHTPKPK